MKTLLLMRHAKSSWKFTDLKDQDRPLNKRGRNDAPLMGQLILDRELVPQRIISSTAVRARETAEILVDTLKFEGEVTYLDRLYMAESDDHIAVLRDLPDEVERVMIIGHHPGLEYLLQELAGRVESLPTAVLAHIVLPIDQWSQLKNQVTGEMVEIWKPKEVREELEEEEKQKEKEKSKSKKDKDKKEKEKKSKSKKKDK